MTKLIERREKGRMASKDKDIIILYHGDCSDGFGAAWAAWKKFGDDAQYIPVYYFIPPPSGLVDKIIYMIDFVYPEDITRKLIKENKQVTAIDHHISNQDVAKITQDYSFDNDHSGAGLAWRYFHPNTKVPDLVNYIEKRDLWKFDLPDIEEILSAIDLYDFSFTVWSQLAEDLDNPDKRREIIEKGKLIKQYDDNIIKRLVSKISQKVEFEGIETYAINSPLYNSELGAALYKSLPPIAIIWFKAKNDITAVSLRSDGSVDVSELASRYGGGGHKSSSGFTLDEGVELPWKVIKNNG